MQTVTDTFMSDSEIKKSTFISFITPIEHFEPLHSELKEKHPKARHIVWAKRYLNEFSQIVENSSDDGEPKGTSGPPILNVLRGSELIECGILIVRYFGGTKLGTGGLVRAYGGGAKEVIAHAVLVPFVKKELIKFITHYTLVSRFEHFLEKENISPCERIYEAHGVVWSVDLSEDEKKMFLDFATMFEREGFSLEL